MNSVRLLQSNSLLRNASQLWQILNKLKHIFWCKAELIRDKVIWNVSISSINKRVTGGLIYLPQACAYGGRKLICELRRLSRMPDREISKPLPIRRRQLLCKHNLPNKRRWKSWLKSNSWRLSFILNIKQMDFNLFLKKYAKRKNNSR